MAINTNAVPYAMPREASDICSARGYDIQVVRQCHALVEDTSRQLGKEIGRHGEQDRAVSPDTRPTDKIRPVMIFGKAIGSTTRRMVCNFVAPNAKLPCRNESSMLFRASSVVRIIRGSDINASVNEPAMIESPQPNALTNSDIPNKPNTTDGPAQVVCHDTDETDQFAVCRIFVHVDAAHDPDRETDDTASGDQVESPDNRREDSTFRHALFRCFRQEIPADHAASFNDDEP